MAPLIIVRCPKAAPVASSSPWPFYLPEHRQFVHVPWESRHRYLHFVLLHCCYKIHKVLVANLAPSLPARAAARRERLARVRFRIPELAFGPPPRQRALLQRRDASQIVAAILEAFERFDELLRDRLVANDSDNAAHPDALHKPSGRAEPTSSSPRVISTSR